MDLAILSEQQGDFYVPAYEVKVDGQALTAQHQLAVSQVEADLSLDKAGHFSFTVVHSYDNEDGEFKTGNGRSLLDLLKFGAVVDIHIGYGSRLPLLLSGTISEIATEFPQDGAPELIISGKDLFFPLTLGKKTQSWMQVRDSDVVRRIAGNYNLDVEIQQTSEVHKQVEQNMESDLAFIGKLARRNHFEFFMAGRTLVFRRPKHDGSGAVTLKRGTSLLTFRPQANLSGQFSRVEVRGWDPKQKKPIVGIAVAGEESGRDPNRRSAGEELRKISNDTAVYRIRQPVLTQAEADTYAKAVLDDCAKKFLTADAESLGFAELRPGRNVTLEGLGTRFSKTYYLEQATHRADGNGYRTTFKVKEPDL